MKSLTYIEIDVPDFAGGSPVAEVTYRFTFDNDYLPASIDAIASLVSVSYSPSRISLGENLGERASLTIILRDHRHIFNGEAFDSGTFWGKWRARYGTKLRGRSLRWITGLEGQALDEMDTLYFVVESTDGPTPDGKYTIIAKDVLKLADNDRAQAPALSTGFLVGAIDIDDTAGTLTPSGIGNAEYPASGYVNIGGNEVCAFTRSGDALTLTRAQLGSVASAHDAGDRVQLVLRYDGDDPADIIRDLLVNYAGVPADYIPLSSWQDETGSFLQRVYTANIAEPTGVNKLISELVEQAALAVWWEPSTQLLRLQVLRAISTTADVFDEDNTIAGSLTSKEQPDKRVSQVWTYFAQIDPTEPLDQTNNYRSVALTADLDAEADYGGAAIKKIFSRWIPTGGRQVALRLNDILLSRYKDPPRQFGFSAFRYGPESPMLGVGYQLGSWSIQDVDGAAAMAPIQITRLDPGNDLYRIEAEEMLFSGVVADDLNDRVVIIDSSINSINLRTLHDQLYPEITGTESPTPTVTFIIQSGVIVGSNSALTPACDVGTWAAGITPSIRLLGRIQGAGGAGGAGAVPAQAGKAGGTALFLRSDILLESSAGEIWGGGGGGGGSYFSGDEDSPPSARSGGGGGAGQLPGSGGAAGSGYQNGDPGTNEAGGQGGAGGGFGKGAGGDGGDPGQAGSSGDGASGGAAGKAIDGVSHISYGSPSTVDIRGSQVN